MSDDVKALRDEFEKFKKMATKEIEAQAKAIRKLQDENKELREADKKLTTYVNNLMKKADNLIQTKFAALRRTQVIDRQKLNDLDSEVAQLSRKK
ncbi:predicted ORF [Xanthomonas phage XacN1]|nr:predicted ORF [Xanthomonas phage XacN1]